MQLYYYSTAFIPHLTEGDFSPVELNNPFTTYSKLFISGELLNLKETRKVYKWK
jgi:hypothetical protein